MGSTSSASASASAPRDPNQSPSVLRRARDYRTGAPLRLEIADGRWTRIQTIEPGSADDDAATIADEWIAPAFWDLQTNGRWGVSFADADLTIEDCEAVARAQGGLGTARFCPTLITAPPESLHRGVDTIRRVCENSKDLDRRILGIHLEGPMISELDGYRGAHPLSAVRDLSWEEFQRLQEASGGRIAIVTLAPERPGALDFIRRAVKDGVVISLGHTAADGDAIRKAADAGATLSTHLGNGIAAIQPRHPNPIWEQAAEDRLWASLIADGHHLSASVLRVLVRAKTLDRVILVSDASPLAGLPAGRYGDWEVHPSGKIVVAGTDYLAGSNRDLIAGLNLLIRECGASMAQAADAVTTHPARLLGCPSARLAEGQPASFVILRRDPESPTRDWRIAESWIDGEPQPIPPSRPSLKSGAASRT